MLTALSKHNAKLLAYKSNLMLHNRARGRGKRAYSRTSGQEVYKSVVTAEEGGVSMGNPHAFHETASQHREGNSMSLQ